MRQLALHLQDLGENSLAAGATRLAIEVRDLASADLVEFVVADNGRGMAESFVKKLTDPFATTRTKRQVGLGIPLLAQAAERTGGGIQIESSLGEGTVVRARFCRSHLDLAPMGDLALTVMSLIVAQPELDLEFYYETDKGSFQWQSQKAQEAAAPLSLAQPEVACFIRDYLWEQIGQLQTVAADGGGKC